jgi:fructoselysine-6-P-deglycase FrlB-like protein
MTITRGENGATFVKDGTDYNFKLTYKAHVIDSTGAGDAFISSIIKDCIKNNFIYNQTLFEKWYENCNKLTTKVVSKMGARGHINALFKVKKIVNECTCNVFIFNERKKIKRCNININNLETRIKNAIDSPAISKIKNIDFNGNDNCLFIGTGGSYAGTYFSAKVINLLYGCNTYSMYPRDVLYRNNNNINKVLLFSYSGTTNDIIASVKNLNKNNMYIITKGELQKIVLKTGILKKNIISYRTSTNKGKERGFLSFEGAVAPAAIFLMYYLEMTNSDININDFIKESINNWNTKLKKDINIDFINLVKKSNLINLFRGDYADSACYDLESKFIESGIFNCIIHEKKNFSHGRFINYENLNNSCSIYFKQKETTKYEQELLKYLNKKCIVIESKYDGILAEFDLLIASQYIIYYIGNVMNIDVSKPKYSEEAMKIYFYNGDL